MRRPLTPDSTQPSAKCWAEGRAKGGSISPSSKGSLGGPVHLQRWMRPPWDLGSQMVFDRPSCVCMTPGTGQRRQPVGGDAEGVQQLARLAFQAWPRRAPSTLGRCPVKFSRLFLQQKEGKIRLRHFPCESPGLWTSPQAPDAKQGGRWWRKGQPGSCLAPGGPRNRVALGDPRRGEYRVQ